MKTLTFNYNTTCDEIEKLNIGDRLTVEETNKIGGVYSVTKTPANTGHIYKIILLSDKGLFFEVFFKRPTVDQMETYTLQYDNLTITRLPT